MRALPQFEGKAKGLPAVVKFDCPAVGQDVNKDMFIQFRHGQHVVVLACVALLHKILERMGQSFQYIVF